MTYDNILYDVTDHVATITINRPESMNAISYKARDELHDACGRVSADPDVWACIITGAGERAFSTGLDLKERAREVDDSTFFDKRRTRNRAGNQGQNMVVASMEKPTIAAIRGYAVGGGLGHPRGRGRRQARHVRGASRPARRRRRHPAPAAACRHGQGA